MAVYEQVDKTTKLYNVYLCSTAIATGLVHFYINLQTIIAIAKW